MNIVVDFRIKSIYFLFFRRITAVVGGLIDHFGYSVRTQFLCLQTSENKCHIEPGGRHVQLRMEGCLLEICTLWESKISVYR